MLEVRNEIELHSMQELIEFVRNQLDCNQYIQCEKKITEAMARYPNAPEPHNLFPFSSYITYFPFSVFPHTQ